MSYLNRQAMGGEPTRKGAVVPVEYIDDIDDVLMKALEAFPLAGQKGDRKESNTLSTDLSKRRTPNVAQPENDDELSAVCNVAIRNSESLDDKEILARLTPIVEDYKQELLARRVRSEDDLEYATGAPVLAVVGQPRQDNFLVAWGRRLIDREGASRRRALAAEA